MPEYSPTIRLGARGSLLSRMQSQGVADALMARHPGLRVELTIITTTGDTITDKPLHAFGGKGLFTRELEQALLDGAVDLAVHSFKDVPVTMPLVDQSRLAIACVPLRVDARDVLVSEKAESILHLPHGARVGTGALRRQAQLLAMRPDLNVEMVRGNVDTRIRKLKEKQFDAVILAAAGLQRSELFDASFMFPIAPEQMLPSAGQGALALQCVRGEPGVAGHVSELLAAIHDENTALAVGLEREVVRRLKGDCHSPIGAFAQIDGGMVRLRAAVGKKGGHPPLLLAEASAASNQAVKAVDALVEQLNGLGVQAHLHG